MERVLEFEKFRNLGFNQKDRIVLNNSLEKGKMGNLVIVVGANNSGKSNVLDALYEFSNQRLSERDRTELSYKEEDRKPALTLKTKDGNDIYSYKIIYGNANGIAKFPEIEEPLKQIIEDNNKIINVIRKACQQYGIAIDRYQLTDSIEVLKNKHDRTEIENVDSYIKTVLNNIRQDSDRHGGYYRYMWNMVREECRDCRYFTNTYERNLTKLDSEYSKIYGIKFMPQIMKYNEYKLTNSNICSRINTINNNKFFKALFTAIKFDINELLNAYESFNKLAARGILSKLEKELNKKIESIAADFNNMYILQQDKYKFEIVLDPDLVSFTMYKNDQYIVLDYQSIGFKWFFNLYFTFLCDNTLNAGDIVIMDEPATNLHVRGQQELRKFIKDFAIKNDVTIVIATHSPFLIDMDNLDELRVVSSESGMARINNDFSTIATDDPDSLMPIKEALTVSNHVLYDPDKKVVFVEGITDYNYMVAFKNKFKIKDVVFLPIQGVGKYGTDGFKEKQKEISKRLIKIKKHSPILMVDGDGAGKSMKNTNKDSELIVFTLTDINAEYKNVENLFSEADLKKLGIETSNGEYVKSSSKSALFKTFINIIELSSETEKNFRAVFDYIEKI